MDEIGKIISAISEVTGLDRYSIIYGRNDECKKARGILCYIALKDKYGLTKTLCESLGKSRSQCAFMADFCKEEMEESIGYLILMNEIRKKLGMSAIMQGRMRALQEEKQRELIEEAEKRSKANAKNIFGVKYSKSEEEQLKKVMQESAAFMADYCRIGIKATGRLTRCPY